MASCSTGLAPWMRCLVPTIILGRIPENRIRCTFLIKAPKFARVLQPAYITPRRQSCSWWKKAQKKFLPEVDIQDWPALAYRGFMMDTSHGPLPTEDEIKRQINFLARWKANQYYLSEANIELRGYPLINPGARYTESQIRRIIDYARERHVDIVPCLELYGHLHDLFRVERYADLAALPHGGEINPRNPRVQSLLRDWVQQLTALFPSPWFHVGMDEPWELEKSRQQSRR